MQWCLSYRLGEIAIDSQELCTFAVTTLTVGCQHYQRQLLYRWDGTYSLRKLKPIHLRHLKVDNRYIIGVPLIDSVFEHP